MPATISLLLPLATFAAAQPAPDMAVGDDCAFLTRAFKGSYQGIREEEGKLENADAAKVMMYVAMQSNTLQLAEAAGCDVRPMIEIARNELMRYEEDAGKYRTGGESAGGYNVPGKMRPGHERGGEGEQ